MSDNIILEHPRAIRGDLAEAKLDLLDVKPRVCAIAIANLASAHRAVE